LEFGDKRAFFEELKKKGVKTPLDIEPPEDAITTWYLKAIRDLVNRSGLQIPWSEIYAYFRLFDLIVPVDRFREVLQDSLEVYANHRKMLMEKAEKNKKKAPHAKRRRNKYNR
jgi:hypothetical protein